jgi:hypothetical protein
MSVRRAICALTSLLLPAAAQSAPPAPAVQGPPPPPAATTRLVYDLEHRELEELLERTGAKPEQVAADVVAAVKKRVGAAATVQALRGTMFEVVAPGDAASIDALRARIERTCGLEMRAVADELFQEGDLRFDLQQERQRLQKWLDAGGRELVRKRPQDVARYNNDRQNGPLAHTKGPHGTEMPALRWYPHRIQPFLEKGCESLWQHPYSKDTAKLEGVEPLGTATVPLFDDNEWNNGRVPAELAAAAAARGNKPCLVELVAINMAELSFCGADLDPAKVRARVDTDGIPVLEYSLRPEFCAAYGAWSQKYIRRHMAILLDGEIRSAPFFLSRIPGRGRIAGAFTAAELEALAASLRAGEHAVPVLPVLVRSEPGPAK